MISVGWALYYGIRINYGVALGYGEDQECLPIYGLVRKLYEWSCAGPHERKGLETMKELYCRLMESHVRGQH